MKTIQEINSDIKEIMAEFNYEGESRQAKKARKKLALYKKCIYYLEANPRIDFIHNQIQMVNKNIESIGMGFTGWKQNTPAGEFRSYKNPKAVYHRMMGLKNLKDQLSTLKYITK